MRAKIDLRKLPPLNALKGFEATSRRQSVRDAADVSALRAQGVDGVILGKALLEGRLALGEVLS